MLAIGRLRGSPRVTASPREKVVRDAEEKEGGHGHRPCEETRVPSSVPIRRVQLQKSAGSILAPNKLVRSARKRVAVRVNGSLARRGRGRENVRGSVERTRCWRVGLHAYSKSGEGSAETQDGVRTSFNGRHIAERRCSTAVAGPGL